MAVDKLVDSTQLDADLTTIANAIRTKGGTSAQLAFPQGMADAIAAIPSGGITPTGNINITDTNVTDVTNYATARVVEANLVASNIKKDVNILGVIGSFEGGGGLPPTGISKQASGTFVVVEDAVNSLTINHGLSAAPNFVFVTALDTKASSSTFHSALYVPADNKTATINLSAYNNNKSAAPGTTSAIRNVDSTSFDIMRQASNYFMTNIRYYWYAAVVE